MGGVVWSKPKSEQNDDCGAPSQQNKMISVSRDAEISQVRRRNFATCSPRQRIAQICKMSLMCVTHG